MRGLLLEFGRSIAWPDFLIEARPAISGSDQMAAPPIEVQTDYDRVMLGEGVLDLPHVIGLLKQIRYEGPVSLELFNETLWHSDPADVLRTGFHRLSALIE